MMMMMMMMMTTTTTTMMLSPALPRCSERRRIWRLNSFHASNNISSSSNSNSSQNTSLLSFLCPLLKLFSASDPSLPRNGFFETATSGISSLARLPWGSRVSSEIAEVVKNRDTPQAIQIYEFEACPFCRRVREALTELDLSAEIYPCPKGSIHHRDIVKAIGGKEQ